MKQLLSAGAKNKASLTKKTLTLKKQPVKLAQVSSESESEAETEGLTSENVQEKLKQLLETQQKVRKLTGAFGNQTAAHEVGKLAQSLGVDMNEMKSKSNEDIAQHLAGKVLAQLGTEKSLLQLNGKEDDDDEQIILTDSNEEKDIAEKSSEATSKGEIPEVNSDDNI